MEGHVFRKKEREVLCAVNPKENKLGEGSRLECPISVASRGGRCCSVLVIWHGCSHAKKRERPCLNLLPLQLLHTHLGGEDVCV